MSTTAAPLPGARAVGEGSGQLAPERAHVAAEHGASSAPVSATNAAPSALRAPSRSHSGASPTATPRMSLALKILGSSTGLT